MAALIAYSAEVRQCRGRENDGRAILVLLAADIEA